MRTLLVFNLALALASGASLPSAAPEQAGFSAERLDRISPVMQGHIDNARLAGASGLIARNGKVVYRKAWGDIKFDTIVRMYSMTKAVTGVAAMSLYEEGRFALTDPVSKYLPEFSKMTVAQGSSTVPAERPITVRDLFRHTTGLNYEGPKDASGESAYHKLGIAGGAPHTPFDLAELVRRLATAPLNDQPGTTFRYGYSIDVLGRLIEVVSGKPLDQVFQERVFGPLGMKDSAFYVPEEKWSRLGVLYTRKQGGGIERSTAWRHRRASRRSRRCCWAARAWYRRSTITRASA